MPHALAVVQIIIIYYIEKSLARLDLLDFRITILFQAALDTFWYGSFHQENDGRLVAMMPPGNEVECPSVAQSLLLVRGSIVLNRLTD
jgi:hypothetical protein